MKTWWIVGACTLGAVLFLLWVLLSSQETPRSAARRATRPKEEHRQESEATPTPNRRGTPSSAPAEPIDEALARLADLEQGRRQALAPLFSARDEFYEALFKNGKISEEELLLARVEAAFNRAVVDDAKRESALRLLDRSAEALRGLWQRLVQAGKMAPAQRDAMERAVSALRAAVRWFESPLYTGAESGLGVRVQEQPRKDIRDRLGLKREILKTRRERLQQELEVLDAALSSKMSGAPKAATTALRVRSLLVRARLGPLHFEEARAQAEKELAEVESELDPERHEDLKRLVALFDWYGSAAMQKLYGD